MSEMRERVDAGTTYFEAWSRVVRAIEEVDPGWYSGGIPILVVEEWIRSHSAPPARPTPTRPATCGECRYYSERDIECGIEPRQQPRAAYTPACRHGESK